MLLHVYIECQLLHEKIEGSIAMNNKFDILFEIEFFLEYTIHMLFNVF